MDPFGFCVIRTQTDSSGNDSVPEDLRILNFFWRGGGGRGQGRKTKAGEYSCCGEGQYRKKPRTVCRSCYIAFLLVVVFSTKDRIFARRDQDFLFF